MRIKFSYLLAAGLTAAVAGWMLTGQTIVAGAGDNENSTPPPAERKAENGDDPFAVRVRSIVAEPRHAELEIRGRTEAEARVMVRAETSARVVERPATEGASVEPGEILCVLDRGTREARVMEFEAALAQAELDHNASSSLSSKGFAAQTRVAALKAARDAAEARLKEAKLELERTVIKAPVAGRLESPMAEVGTTLEIGDTCAAIVDADPMLAIGQVSERNIGALKLGQEATVELVTGQTVDGKVRYIAPSADPDTRTFRVEIEIPNSDGTILDGITVLARLPLDAGKAHRISPSTLTLNDEGVVGLRTVNDDNSVEFIPVEILGGDTKGLWVSGLPETVRVITVGQDYVIEGQTVQPIVETAEVSQ
ncbi:efflux RND transporter periplasmic adaptor subunit [Rhizobiales bacterium]|uniref:efflux RND transporter periplasmic adaptor subunit n=1 Tax=Hongsoonwoonella zoysiae TaxID=2821844 RepID=UPI0015617C0E|nr:efflux RND transporter periplasmic adaptor subunit [Hongsoonwoonella zoysiae]NRG19036.1 efflux RND transporter periplasmic adaptor subunit [Hongsoonwoonella zoysiae]